MSGTLFVVATPIGNLEDITLRALRVLREVDLIAAEDTRRTAQLLARHSIATPTESFHAHNVRQRVPQLIRRLEDGASIAVVSDAGTPGISDPGLELVQACRERDIRVEPVPGASAPLAAAVASGFPLESLTILGFPPSRSKARKTWLQDASGAKNTITFFESPHRITTTLGDMVDIFGNRPIVVARELTKVHEQFLSGSAADLVGQLTDPRGEFTVVVGPAIPQDGASQPSTDDVVFSDFCRLTELGGRSRRDVVVEVASRHGRTAKDVYSTIERLKNNG